MLTQFSRFWGYSSSEQNNYFVKSCSVLSRSNIDTTLIYTSNKIYQMMIRTCDHYPIDKNYGKNIAGKGDSAGQGGGESLFQTGWPEKASMKDDL